MTDDELLAAIERRDRAELDRARYNRNGCLLATDHLTRFKAEQAGAQSNQLNRKIVDELKARGGSWRRWAVTADGINYYDQGFAWRGRAAAV